jgi:PTH1 family peptidyl-tRNA hydrolase
MIVGLGNVGAEFARTRHNAGFWFVDRLASRYGAAFRTEKKFSGELARAAIGGQDVWLVKPATFMNLSGQCVVAVALFYRVLPDQILVAHDELDLAPGDVRLKQGGGVAGHNGLKDIRARLSNADFWRLRIGIGHPRTLDLRQDVADFVLHPPRREEERAIDGALDRAESVIELAAAGQFPAAMTRLHTSGGAAPPDAGSPRPPRTPKTPKSPAPPESGAGPEGS